MIWETDKKGQPFSFEIYLFDKEYDIINFYQILTNNIFSLLVN
jgi:hypothetical protein